MTPRPPRVAEALADWLPLVDASGPFLTLPVLRRAFPNGFPRVDAGMRAEMRQRIESLGSTPAELSVWLRWVLHDLLEYGDRLVEGPAVPEALQHVVPEHGVTLRPDFALIGAPEPDAPSGRARLLVEAYALGTDFTKPLPDARWTATPVERMALLCRATGVELGLITDTNAFTLVWAPRSGATATATWMSSLWSEERGLFEAFVALLGARRFFAVDSKDTLEALFAESATAQIEVTNQLGKQVRQAVELLVDAFSRANRESDGQLMDDLGAGDLETAAEMMYAAAVTVMMRLVFLLCAEERRLFPVGDALYDESYAVSTMLDQLQEETSVDGEETLERRLAAWNRLLATFRLVHDGVQHEMLRIPAYGGTLFDPDRFPFLEGRRPGTTAAAGGPPAITDRSVMAILDALQYLTFKGETRRVSYRSLDVEQIGHVYEGLLDHGCQVVDEVLLGLDGRDEPEIALAQLEDHRARGADALAGFVAEQTGRSTSAVTKGLKLEIDADTRRFLLEACENDQTLFARVAPFVGLLRRDLRGLPAVFLPGAVCMTQTSSRRDSGTEYTTRELADEVVRYTLEPLVYSPGPQDGAPPDEWKLRSSAEILALRVCDPAVGSGAILVAACRYLAERLAEAWVAGGVLPPDAAGDPEALTIAARRAVVDHCLYGVDRNPMAAEMAKLSLWLVTMAKERPFSFLDHAIQSGDSLLGLTSMEQLTTFHIDPERGRVSNPDLWGHARAVEATAERAVALYRAMANLRALTVRDAEEKARLHVAATDSLAGLRLLADAVVGAALATAHDGAAALDARLSQLAETAAQVAGETPDSDSDAKQHLRVAATADLNTEPGADGKERHPLHWPLAFPEVFLGRNCGVGFDALVGNPPFMKGKGITSPFGSCYREFLVERIAGGRRGNADLVSYFFLRAKEIVREGGTSGLVATNSVAQGESKKVGLDWLAANGVTTYRAEKTREWPGSAAVVVSLLWQRQGPWSGAVYLDGRIVPGITPSLDALTRVSGVAQSLAANRGKAFQGSIILGDGFLLSPEEARAVIAADPRNSQVVMPYLIGEDVTTSPTHTASRWVINFAEMPREVARTYRRPWALVEERVEPERRKKDEKKYPRMVQQWWKFWNYRGRLYDAIQDFERVMVIPLTSRTMMPVFVEAGTVYSHALGVFAFDSYFHLGVLSSTPHWLWAVRRSSFKTDTRYTPSDAFETFPLPPESPIVGEAARDLDRFRHSILEATGEGLTLIYNRVHNPDESSAAILRLREIHAQLDAAVCGAYGWNDLALQNGFHETVQGVRFSLSPAVAAEVHDRLLELNHARYAEEVRLGLHEPVTGKAKRGPARPGKRQAVPVDSGEQVDLLATLAPATSSTKRKRS